MPESSAAMDTVAPRIDLLGPPGLVDNQGRRLALERKAAALLAVLALDGARSRASLAALLWPEVSAAAARNSLRQRLFRLQRAAGAELVQGQEELRLADRVALDLASATDRLAQDPQAPAGDLLEALDYGDTIELADWVDAARARWRARRADCLAACASRHESLQQVALALQYAQRLLADEPLLEHAHRRVMRLHYLRGDRAAALAAYAHCVATLQAHLGAQPDPETAALATTIGSDEAPTASGRALAPPVSVLRPPRLVGRDAASARLAGAVAARRVLLLQGEPGIGKSRLLADAVAVDPTLLVAGAQPGDGRVPYALLARLAGQGVVRFAVALPPWVAAELARLVPALGAAPGARVDPLRLQQAFGAALAAWADGGLTGLAIDDLHHADEASLEALLALAGRDDPARPPLAWLLAVRSQEKPVPLQAWLAEAGPERIEHLELPPLDAAQVGALLADLNLERLDASAWQAPLTRHSGGNPLFLLETVRALLALGASAPGPQAALPVPAALDRLIERRLAGLDPAALKLARVAALAGGDFDADVAAAVLDAHPLDIVEPWRALEQAQLLADGRFVHDLIAETILKALPAGIAQALQARLAASLERLGRGPARVAPHWAAAQAWSRAGDAYAAAARDARRASRRSDELALWQHAAEGFDRAGQPGKAFDARADGVEVMILVRGVSAAAAQVDRLDADQRTEPQRLRALSCRACVCLMAGQAADAETAARAALDAATRLGAQWPRFEAARLLAVALAQAGRADEALAAIEPFRTLVTTQGDAEQRHHFWADYAYALKAAQRAHDTADALRHAMASAQEAGDHAELATLTSNLALVEGNLGRVDQALDHARRARALIDPLGLADGPPAGAVELYVSVHEAALGRYAEALAGFERARACFAGSPDSVWNALTANHLASVLIHLGQYARARQALQQAGATTTMTQARRLLLEARIDRALGQHAEKAVGQALAAVAPGDVLMQLLVQLDATRLMAPAEAAEACAALVQQAERHEHLAVGMRGRMLALGHRTAAGDATRDEVDDLIVRLGRCQPADTYWPEAWWTAAGAYDALGLPEDAEAALAAGYDWVVGRALPNVPFAFRDSFLHRNRVNRGLLAAAANRLDRRLPPGAEAAG